MPKFIWWLSEKSLANTISIREFNLLAIVTFERISVLY